MSSRTDALLLRCYPRRWRARYGEELEALILASTQGRRPSLRTRWDLLRGALTERMRSAGLGGEGVPAEEQVRAWMLVVLCAWTLFVLAGIGLQKFSEHWQSFTSPAQRGLPAGAFEVLIVAALLGGAMAMAGVLISLPRLIAHVREHGWRELRPALLRAIVLSLLALAIGAGLVVWAHRLGNAQRNGADIPYVLAFLGWAAAMASALVAWTTLAVKAARRMSMGPRLLAFESWLAAAVSVSMLAVTAAAGVWWTALARDAPWALQGHARGSGGATASAQLLAISSLMLASALLASLAATRALRALARLRAPLRAAG